MEARQILWPFASLRRGSKPRTARRSASQERMALSALDDRLLKDIGVTREMVWKETRLKRSDVPYTRYFFG